ncbi:MAG: DUF4166 domain-containing protein [Microbacterium sp.]
MGDLSVYEQVLGERFAELDPRLHRYFRRPPAGHDGSGRGVYEQAGSGRRVLRPLLHVMAWRQTLFPESGRGIPFTILNTVTDAGTLRAVRTFGFPGRTRVMRDEMSVRDGFLVDRLGRRGGLEVRLGLEVHQGAMRLRSDRLVWRIARLRIPLPRVARVTVDERATAAGQHVDVRLRSPLIGEFFRYSGTFTYDDAPAVTSS